MTLDVLDADRIARPETPWSALRRRLSGRYPVDPFGLDPQLADLCVPLFTAAVRVRIAGGEHVPTTGAAVIVSNRGFGIAEPAALGVAVQRASGRRLRVVGAPDLPFVGTAMRRLGAISSSGPGCRVGAARRPPRRHPARAHLVANRRGRRAARGRARSRSRRSFPRPCGR